MPYVVHSQCTQEMYFQYYMECAGEAPHARQLHEKQCTAVPTWAKHAYGYLLSSCKHSHHKGRWLRKCEGISVPCGIGFGGLGDLSVLHVHRSFLL